MADRIEKVLYAHGGQWDYDISTSSPIACECGADRPGDDVLDTIPDDCWHVLHLAAALREAGIGDMAQAWDEGRIHGHVDRGGYDLGDGCGPDPHDCTCANPYRKGGGGE